MLLFSGKGCSLCFLWPGRGWDCRAVRRHLCWLVGRSADSLESPDSLVECERIFKHFVNRSVCLLGFLLQGNSAAILL